MPSIPIHENRSVNLIANPFLPDVQNGEEVPIIHPACSDKRIQIIVPADGHVDGLIKVRLRKEQREGRPTSLVERMPLRNQNLSQFGEQVRVSHEIRTEPSSSPNAGESNRQKSLAYLPESFGRPRLDATDKKLFDFCKTLL